MSWSKVSAKIGKTGENDAMATALASVGIIKDKSTTLATEDGEPLTAKATGGVTVAMEEGEGDVVLSMRVIEPSFDFETSLTGAVADDEKDELQVKTNVVSEDFSVELTPKNVGATGIRIRKSHIKYKPGFSEEEGHYVDLTFTVLECEDGELYTKFKKKA